MSSFHTVKITAWLSGNSEATTFEVPKGENLRKALLSQNHSPYLGSKKVFNCRGLGICGTCKVLVRENHEWWERRSCQIQCFKNLEIQLK